MAHAELQIAPEMKPFYTVVLETFIVMYKPAQDFLPHLRRAHFLFHLAEIRGFTLQNPAFSERRMQVRPPVVRHKRAAR